MRDRQYLLKRQKRLPRIWLMTDPRFGDDLLPAIQRLPVRSGVIFRHYTLPVAERRALFDAVRRICARRGHILLLAGDAALARHWHAHGFHGGKNDIGPRQITSMPVHNRGELSNALRRGADMLLISPVFATASHPGQRPLGRLAFMALAKQCRGKAVIALGGVGKRTAATLNKRQIHGWAAIDAFRR
jgi:thiamine-phosphate pyrophosphorylase